MGPSAVSLGPRHCGRESCSNSDLQSQVAQEGHTGSLQEWSTGPKTGETAVGGGAFLTKDPHVLLPLALSLWDMVGCSLWRGGGELRLAEPSLTQRPHWLGFNPIAASHRQGSAPVAVAASLKARPSVAVSCLLSHSQLGDSEAQ